MNICKSNLTKKSANTETDRKIERCLKNVKKEKCEKDKGKKKKTFKRQTDRHSNK